MTDVSAAGFQITVKDSALFPMGFTVKRTTDDADPFDFPDQTIGAASSDANGYLVYAAEANPINFAISVLPTTEEAANFARLFEAHRPAAGRARTGGKITVTVSYSDGSSVTATNCKIISGPPARGISQAGRYKTATYNFAAENII